MAIVQLKAYWASFPLTTSPADDERCEVSNSSVEKSCSPNPKMRVSNERKQLLESLRSTIEDKGQAQAKKRKTHEPAESPKNSENGKDQNDCNRGNKVEAGKNDLQQSELIKERGIASEHQQGNKRCCQGSICMKIHHQ